MRSTAIAFLLVAACAGDPPPGAARPTAVAPEMTERGGVAFVHGTADEDGGGFYCEGAGDDDWRCVAPQALDEYWTADFVDSVRQRPDGSWRPYAVAGCRLATRQPWWNPSPRVDNDGAGEEPGGADCVAVQLAAFLRGPDGATDTADDVTDLVIVGHSGGPNHVRYILQQYTRDEDYRLVKERTRRVVGLAAPYRGTYLANWVQTSGTADFLNGTVDFFGGSRMYDDDGVAFIQTGHMQVYNPDPARFGCDLDAEEAAGDPDPCNPVAGVTFRSGFGVYPDAGVWDSRTWCGGYQYAAGLNLLHRMFLSANDPDTYRDGCSDGFIPCMSSGALGQVFEAGRYENHQQTRRVCATFDAYVRDEVSGGVPRLDDPEDARPAADLPPAAWDGCGFGEPATLDCGGVACHRAGCPPEWLGDGWCDWDCFAVWGADAAPSWDAAGTRVVAWGAADCELDDAASAWSPAFDGRLEPDSATVYVSEEIDPARGLADSSSCPESFLDDGTCDECWLARAGADGNDCLPGRVAGCRGLTTSAPAWSGDAKLWNDQQRELAPRVGGCGNGRCDPGECRADGTSTCPGDCTHAGVTGLEIDLCG